MNYRILSLMGPIDREYSIHEVYYNLDREVIGWYGIPERPTEKIRQEAQSKPILDRNNWPNQL